MNPAIFSVLFLFSPVAASGAAAAGAALEKKPAELLASMRKAFEAGDCASVQEMSAELLGQSPPRRMREEVFGYLGGCYEAAGLTDRAIALYKEALGLFPDNILFASGLAGIYNKAGFYESAVPLFLQILIFKNDDITANLGLARAYNGLGYLKKAKEYYSKTAALQKYSAPEVMREYSVCLLKQRDWREAGIINAKGAQAEPAAAFWPLMAARSLAGQGDYQKAVENMDAAIRLGPSRQGRLERGLYLLLGGQAQQALQAADAQLAADGGDALASVLKALALYTIGEKQLAKPYFAAAAAADGESFTGKLAAAFLAAGQNGGQGACKE